MDSSSEIGKNFKTTTQVVSKVEEIKDVASRKRSERPRGTDARLDQRIV